MTDINIMRMTVDIWVSEEEDELQVAREVVRKLRKMRMPKTNSSNCTRIVTVKNLIILRGEECYK